MLFERQLRFTRKVLPHPQRMSGMRWQRAQMSLAFVLACAAGVPGRTQQIPGAPATSSSPAPGLLPGSHTPAKGEDTNTPLNNPDVKTDSAPANILELPATYPAGRQSIGLVLDGGGALGLAHIGVLEWFEDNRIPIDRLSGASMGALVGGLYATGYTARELEGIAVQPELQSVFHLQTDYRDLSFRRREDRVQRPSSITFGIRHGLRGRNAFLADGGLNDFLTDKFGHYDNIDLRFDQLPIPFRCVATDLTTLHPVFFEGGPLPQAIRASIAIPGIFAPVPYAGHYLADGGLMDNLPTAAAKQDLHADVVIAVKLPSTNFTEADVGSIVGVFARGFSAGTAANERVSETLATLVIEPDTRQFTTAEYAKAEELIRQGYIGAEAKRQQLMGYALSESDWQVYLQAKQARRSQKRVVLQQLAIKGGSPGVQAAVRQRLNPQVGQIVTPIAVDRALGTLTSQGYGLAVATAPSIPAARQTADTSVQQKAPVIFPASGTDTGVIVRLLPDRQGPPYLLLGLDATAMSGNVTRTTLDARVIDSNFGGFGSELRTDVRVGFLTEASTEYYRLLNTHGLYIQPHLGILRQPVYIFSNQRRIAERQEQDAGGGLDLGRTFNPRTQLAAEWRDRVVRWQTVTGNDRLPNLSGTAQTGMVHFIYDHADDAIVSNRSVYINLAAGALFHALGTGVAPLLKFHIAANTTVSRKNIFGGSMDADSYFRHNVADPLRFTLGGPLQLSASSIDEYRGTDIVWGRAGYLRKIGALPTGYGEGIYALVGYEGGEVWRPEGHAQLRQDGVFGLVGVTPVGSLTLGGAVGDAGRRKVFFTFGRLF